MEGYRPELLATGWSYEIQKRNTIIFNLIVSTIQKNRKLQYWA